MAWLRKLPHIFGFFYIPTVFLLRVLSSSSNPDGSVVFILTFFSSSVTHIEEYCMMRHSCYETRRVHRAAKSSDLYCLISCFFNNWVFKSFREKNIQQNDLSMIFYLLNVLWLVTNIIFKLYQRIPVLVINDNPKTNYNRIKGIPDIPSSIVIRWDWPEKGRINQWGRKPKPEFTLLSSSTTSRELLSQFSTCRGWRWFDVFWKLNKNSMYS